MRLRGDRWRPREIGRYPLDLRLNSAAGAATEYRTYAALMEFLDVHRIMCSSTHRRVLPLLFAFLLAPIVWSSAASAQSIRGLVRRYRIDSKTQQDVDASAAGGKRQQTLLDRSAFLRVTLTDSAGGKSLHVVIDSILERGANLPASSAVSADSARGKVFDGFLDPAGSVVSLTYPKLAGSLGTALGGQLEVMLPTLKSGFKTGDDWTIRSERPQPVANGRLLVKRSTAYAAMGETVREGIAAARLDMTFTTAVTGTQQVGGATAKVEGNSMGSGSAFVSKAGVYLGGMRIEKTDRRLRVPGAAAPIVVTAEGATTISLLR